METTLPPGIHAGIPFAEYASIDAMNNTTLLRLRGTAAHAKHALDHPEPEETEAFLIGHAAHAAILEPARFAREYAEKPKGDMRTNAAKAAMATWAQAHPQAIPLSASEWIAATGMRDSVWANPLAATLLKGPGQNEMTAIWKDEKTGLLCKARLDRFTTYQGWTTIVDIKTTADEATPEQWGKTCLKYRYHQQAAYYLDGLNALAPRKRRWIHLVVEKAPPHCVAHMELLDTVIAEGRALYREALDMYAQCTKSGTWPGYPVGVEAVDLPLYGYKKTDPTQWRG